LQVHINVHGRVRAKHSARLGALQQAQASKYHYVFVYALDIALHQAGQFAHRQLAFALGGAHKRPAFFGELPKEMAGPLNVEHLALMRALPRRFDSGAQSSLPAWLQGDG